MQNIKLISPFPSTISYPRPLLPLLQVPPCALSAPRLVPQLRVCPARYEVLSLQPPGAPQHYPRHGDRAHGLRAAGNQLHIRASNEDS